VALLLAVLEAAIQVKSINLENQKKKQNMEVKEIFLYKSPSKRSFRHIIHSLLIRADDRGSSDVIYHI